jgi:hypothetical protein
MLTMKAATAVTKMSGGTTAGRRVGRERMPQGPDAIIENTLRSRGLARMLPRSLRAGTVHAPQASGSQQQSLRRWWLSVISACLFTSCVVLPPTADPPAAVPPVLKIATVTPSRFIPTLVSNANESKYFNIEQPFTLGIDATNLHYYWYYDYDDKTKVLDSYVICFSRGASCPVVVCDRPKNTEENHRLLAVVSSGPLLDTAIGPTDFATNTVYDTVTWDIDNTNRGASCSH